MSVNEFFGGLTLMDWIQLSGIIATIASIVAILIKATRDTESLKRDHSDLSKEHHALLNGQEKIHREVRESKEKLSEQLLNKHERLEDKMTSIKSDSQGIVDLLREREKRSQVLSSENRRIADALNDLSVFEREFSILSIVNQEQERKIEVLKEEVKELTDKNQRLIQKNKQLEQELYYQRTKDRGDDSPYLSL